MKLPATLPLFPLPNVILFPGVPLPLHVFEPRYRAMVKDTLREGDPLIGMVLLRGDWQKKYHGSPEIYRVGCAGRIARSEPLDRDRYNVLLAGVREFEVKEENHERPYRVASVAWRELGGGPLPAKQRSHLVELLDRYTDRPGAEPLRKLLHAGSLSDEQMVNFSCYALDFLMIEKQALLEASTLAERGSRLAEMLEFALRTGTEAESPSRNRYH